MKVKLTTAIAVFLLLTLGLTHTARAHASEDLLIRHYNISLIVECLDEAILQMRTLPGLELSSSINITGGYGQAQRIVDSHDLDMTLRALRDMGYTVASNTRADNAFARWTALRREVAVRQHEYNRLVELLHDSTAMADFEMIESRLNRVIHTMDSLRGDLRGLEFQMGTTRINIVLEVLPPEPEPEPKPEPEYVPEPEPEPGAFSRIADAFQLSARLTGRVLQGIAMVFAYISIPLAGFVTLLFIVLRIALRKRRKGGGQNEK